MLHLTLAKLLFLFFAAIFAGTIDTIAGGGGLIVLPSILSVSVPPASALGANRLIGCLGELTAILHFKRKGHIQLHELWLGFVMTAIGASVGTLMILIIHPAHLQKILPFLLLGIFLFFLFSPTLKSDQITQRMPTTLFYILSGLMIGFYNGFFGPGTGSFWIIALMYFMGLQLNQAVMQAKPFNAVGNIASLVCFAIEGHVAYWAVLVMAPGQIIGAWCGSHLVTKHGTQLIRPLFVTVFFILMAKLFYDSYF